MEYIEALNAKIPRIPRKLSAKEFIRASFGFCAVRALRIE
jgi:hypothetical protein